jgi:hypothetical protein
VVPHPQGRERGEQIALTCGALFNVVRRHAQAPKQDYFEELQPTSSTIKRRALSSHFSSKGSRGEVPGLKFNPCLLVLLQFTRKSATFVYGHNHKRSQSVTFCRVAIHVRRHPIDENQGDALIFTGVGSLFTAIAAVLLEYPRPSLHFSARSRLPLRCGTRETSDNLGPDFGRPAAARGRISGCSRPPDYAVSKKRMARIDIG